MSQEIFKVTFVNTITAIRNTVVYHIEASTFSSAVEKAEAQFYKDFTDEINFHVEQVTRTNIKIIS